ncbi:MAG: DNA polymerase III subunit beta [Metamycoplasmataceae bacterium]
MKITTNKNLLLNSLEEIARAIDSNNAYLPLRNIFFDIKDEKMTIIGSNSIISIKKDFSLNNNKDINIEGNGKFLLSSTMFLNTLKKCEGKVEISLFSKELVIKNNGNTFFLNTQDGEEYPEIDFILYGKQIEVSYKDFKECIKNVSFAANSINTSSILNGINLKTTQNKLTFSATDSFRLSTQEIEIKEMEGNENIDITIAVKALKDIVPTKESEKIILYINDYKINIVQDGFIYQSKIIDAPYIDLSNIFLKDFSRKLVISKKELLDAINKAVISSSTEVTNNLTITISDENKIKITSFKEEIGRTEIYIENFKYEGEKTVIVVSYKFLKEAISVCEGDLTILMNGPIERITLFCSEIPTLKQIIAPQRI